MRRFAAPSLATEMSPLELVLSGTGAIVASGLLALACLRAPRLASFIAAAGAVSGCALGLWASIDALTGGWRGEFAATWRIPGGALVVGMDPLSAFFLVPVFTLGALCALYGRGYLGSRVLAATGLNLLLAAMALVLVARHVLLFLVAWEAMTLLAFLLVTMEHVQAEARRAGWVYLIASHAALIAIVAFFLVLGRRAGGELGFAELARTSSAPAAGAAWLLAIAILGFGIKAGVVGLHVWLPEAHAAAPSHVSALMSGALIKLGIYGLLRAMILVAPGSWFGMTLMILGVSGAVLGIALALYQRDLKRILAYSSVENVGIILIALGLGFWARAAGDTGLATIALGGGLLHVWNHAAMKGLLFLGAGSVLHGAATKDIERLGGLLRRMPWTGWSMVIGAVAIAALPPLNGFSGEWLLYRGLARAGMDSGAPSSLAAIAVAGALALVGGLAAVCFVRLVGVVLLGTARGDGAAHAQESPISMTIPMVTLAAACIAGALLAPVLLSLLAPLLGELGGAGTAEVVAAASYLDPLVQVGWGLLAAIALATALLQRHLRRAAASDTWGCGFPSPTPRMQYSGGGFSELLISRVLPRWIHPRLRVLPPEGPFPTSARLASDLADPVTRGVYQPFLVRCGNQFARLRFLQQGNVHIYILYIFATAILGLAWVAARDGLAP